MELIDQCFEKSDKIFNLLLERHDIRDHIRLGIAAKLYEVRISLKDLTQEELEVVLGKLNEIEGIF